MSRVRILLYDIRTLCYFLLAPPFSVVFFFNDTATTEIYTLSLHDALPIYVLSLHLPLNARTRHLLDAGRIAQLPRGARSEEHTSELQSHLNLVCRLLLEKKKKHRPLHVRSKFLVLHPERHYPNVRLLIQSD